MNLKINKKLAVILLSLSLLPFVSNSQPTETEILASIELGVPWLVNQQLPNGSWAESGSYEPIACTGLALTKLSDYAFEHGVSPFDEDYVYYDNVIAGFDFLFSMVKSHGAARGLSITPSLNYHHETYSAAISLMAIAACKTSDRVIVSSNPLVNGKTFLEVQDEMVTYFEWSQSETNGDGGWGYYPNYNMPDNSHTGWVVLALRYAEVNGSMIPDVIKSRLDNFINVIQHPNGASKYRINYDWLNLLKTGNLLLELAFVGDDINSSRVQAALGYIQTHWVATNSDPGYGDTQAMYCLMKGFESYDIDEITVGGSTVNWFDDFATRIINWQNTSGYWSSSRWTGPGEVSTTWALMVLEKVAPPPVCPDDIVVNNTIGVCGALVEYEVSGPYWATITQTDGTGFTSGDVFPIGTTQQEFNIDRGPDGITVCSFTVTVVDVEAPVAVCQNLTIELDDTGNISITADDIDGGSSDNCSLVLTADPLAFTCANLGVNVVTLTATDPAGHVATCTAEVTVTDVLPPVPDVDPLPDLVGECLVDVTAPTATDNCAGLITGTTSNPLSYTDQGTFEITWTFDDGNGNINTQLQTVIVNDVTLPVITAITNPITLWSPNHKYVEFGLSDFVLDVSDNCADLVIDDVRIKSVTSDEPDNVNGVGDGNTTEDIVITEQCTTVLLRAERDGGSNGRVYTLHLELDDGNGNIGEALCFVTVLHSKKVLAVDDGPVFEVTCDYTKSGHIPQSPLAFEGYELTNYPNPFHNSTTIKFTIPVETNVILKIYNIQGQYITALVDQKLLPGTYSVQFKASDLPAGQYIYKLNTNNHSISHKMILNK